MIKRLTLIIFLIFFLYQGFSRPVRYKEETFVFLKNPFLLCILNGKIFPFVTRQILPAFDLYMLWGCFSDQIKINSCNSACFIFCVVSHITSALCDQTGFRNIFWGTGLSIHKELDSILLIDLQFFFQRFYGFLAALLM